MIFIAIWGMLIDRGDIVMRKATKIIVLFTILMFPKVINAEDPKFIQIFDPKQNKVRN
jgi:hypothetical protein